MEALILLAGIAIGIAVGRLTAKEDAMYKSVELENDLVNLALENRRLREELDHCEGALVEQSRRAIFGLEG